MRCLQCYPAAGSRKGALSSACACRGWEYHADGQSATGLTRVKLHYRAVSVCDGSDDCQPETAATRVCSACHASEEAIKDASTFSLWDARPMVHDAKYWLFGL